MSESGFPLPGVLRRCLEPKFGSHGQALFRIRRRDTGRGRGTGLFRPRCRSPWSMCRRKLLAARKGSEFPVRSSEVIRVYEPPRLV